MVKKYVCISRSILVISICNQGKTLCSLCIILPPYLFLVVNHFSPRFVTKLLWSFLSHFVVVIAPAHLIILFMYDAFQIQQNIITDINLSYHFGKKFRPNVVTIRPNKPNYNWMIFFY